MVPLAAALASFGESHDTLRPWVEGNVEDTKTEGSAKPGPMDSDFGCVLTEHLQKTRDL